MVAPIPIITKQPVQSVNQGQVPAKPLIAVVDRHGGEDDAGPDEEARNHPLISVT
jgi:hypothetical protein